MPHKKITKKQLDEYEAIAIEYIRRGHMVSLEPEDDEESFEGKFKRSIVKKRKLMDNPQLKKEKEEIPIIYEFETVTKEKEFQERIRLIIPDPEIKHDGFEHKQEIGSSWHQGIAYTGYDFGLVQYWSVEAQTYTCMCHADRLVAQVNVLHKADNSRHCIYKAKQEPSSYIANRVNFWIGGCNDTWGTRHAANWENWAYHQYIQIKYEGPGRLVIYSDTGVVR